MFPACEVSLWFMIHGFHFYKGHLWFINLRKAWNIGAIKSEKRCFNKFIKVLIFSIWGLPNTVISVSTLERIFHMKKIFAPKWRNWTVWFFSSFLFLTMTGVLFCNFRYYKCKSPFLILFHLCHSLSHKCSWRNWFNNQQILIIVLHTVLGV